MTEGDRELRIAHHHPGRLRLRSRAFAGASGASDVARAKAALGGREGVIEVTDNARTGSLLVVYDPSRVGSDVLVDEVARATGLALSTGQAKPGDEDRLSYVAIDFFRDLNVLAQEMTHPRADLRILVPAALGGLCVWSLATEGARIPPWDTLLYWSYSVFLTINEREIEARRGAPVPVPP